MSNGSDVSKQDVYDAHYIAPSALDEEGLKRARDRVRFGNSFRANTRHDSATARAIPLEWPISDAKSRHYGRWEDRPYIVSVASTRRDSDDTVLTRRYESVAIARQGGSRYLADLGTGQYVMRQYSPAWVSLQNPFGKDTPEAHAGDTDAVDNVAAATDAGSAELSIDLASAIQGAKDRNGGVYPNLRAYEARPDLYDELGGADRIKADSNVIHVYECYVGIHAEGVQGK